MQKPNTVKITRVIEEADGVNTLFFRHQMNFLPGQFIMVWVPKINEKPFALSYSGKGEFGFTVASVGPFSRLLCSMKPGHIIGIRGPYGNGYSINNKTKSAVIVGGGIGSASLILLAEEIARKGIRTHFILGARSKNKLVFASRLKKLLGSRLMITTDDGTAGRKGFVTDSLNDLLQKEKIDMIFACGPEKMLKAVVDIGLKAKVDGQISMERYMKCGFGLCGHCCVDPIGIRLCMEGPVIDFKAASRITEFGSHHRVKSSRKEKL